MTESTADQLAALFREAKAAHFRAFAATDGEDPHWPQWYAEYLAPRLEEALGWAVDVSALAADLGRVDAEHRQVGGNQPWPEFYAQWFLERQRP